MPSSRSRSRRDCQTCNCFFLVAPAVVVVAVAVAVHVTFPPKPRHTGTPPPGSPDLVFPTTTFVSQLSTNHVVLCCSGLYDSFAAATISGNNPYIHVAYVHVLYTRHEDITSRYLHGQNKSVSKPLPSFGNRRMQSESLNQAWHHPPAGLQYYLMHIPTY